MELGKGAKEIWIMVTKELKKNVEEQNAAISVEAQNAPTPEAE